MFKEDDVNFIRDSNCSGYHVFGTLTNGQTIYIGFKDSDYYSCKSYYIILAIANKKKHIRGWLDGKMNPIDLKGTGKCGLEGLLWAKNAIKSFEIFIKSIYPNETIKIEIFWSDQRRFHIYKRGLPDYQYSQSAKALYKKLT